MSTHNAIVNCKNNISNQPDTISVNMFGIMNVDQEINHNIVNCQHCGQPTNKNKKCDHCGGPPLDFKDEKRKEGVIKINPEYIGHYLNIRSGPGCRYPIIDYFTKEDMKSISITRYRFNDWCKLGENKWANKKLIEYYWPEYFGEIEKDF